MSFILSQSANWDVEARKDLAGTSGLVYVPPPGYIVRLEVLLSDIRQEEISGGAYSDLDFFLELEPNGGEFTNVTSPSQGVNGRTRMVFEPHSNDRLTNAWLDMTRVTDLVYMWTMMQFSSSVDYSKRGQQTLTGALSQLTLFQQSGLRFDTGIFLVRIKYGTPPIDL